MSSDLGIGYIDNPIDRGNMVFAPGCICWFPIKMPEPDQIGVPDICRLDKQSHGGAEELTFQTGRDGDADRRTVCLSIF